MQTEAATVIVPTDHIQFYILSCDFFTTLMSQRSYFLIHMYTSYMSDMIYHI